MQIAYNVLVALGLIVATVFGLLVLVTGKGDAMSGGGGAVRTTFKGKASFDDQMSRLTLILGAAFFVLMLLIDGVSNRMTNAGTSTPTVQVTAPSSTTGSTAPASTPASTSGTAPASTPATAPATTSGKKP